MNPCDLIPDDAILWVTMGDDAPNVTTWEAFQGDNSHGEDGNTLNNSIENLEVMTVTTHNLHHHVGTKRPDSLKRSAALFQQLTQEIQRLKSDRADLLAALRMVDTAFAMHFLGAGCPEIPMDLNNAWSDVLDAIAKATGGGS